MTQVYNQDPLMGLFEMENIISVQADGWNDKIIAAKALATEFLTLAPNENVVVVAKDPAFGEKLKTTFDGYSNVIINNVQSDLSAFNTLSNVYGIVVVDSSLFNNHTKYLIAVAAKKGSCRLAFVI